MLGVWKDVLQGTLTYKAQMFAKFTHSIFQITCCTVPPEHSVCKPNSCFMLYATDFRSWELIGSINFSLLKVLIMCEILGRGIPKSISTLFIRCWSGKAISMVILRDSNIQRHLHTVVNLALCVYSNRICNICSALSRVVERVTEDDAWALN